MRGRADRRPLAPRADEAGLAQHAQVLGDRRLADGKRVAEIAGADLRLLRQPLHHPEANRVRECLQLAHELCIGHGLHSNSSIGNYLYWSKPMDENMRRRRLLMTAMFVDTLGGGLLAP